MQTICTSLLTVDHTNTSSLNFYRPDAVPGAQPTASKHWRHCKLLRIITVRSLHDSENDSDNWQLWCCCIKWPETQQIPTYPRWSSRTCFSTAGQVLYSLPQPGQVHLKNTRFDVYNIISTACWNKSVFSFLHHCKHDTGRTCCWPPCCCAQGSESSHVCCRCPVQQLINIVCPRGPRQQPAAVGKRDRQTDTTPSQTLPHTMQAVSIRTIYSAVQSQTRSPQQAQAHLRGHAPSPKRGHNKFQKRSFGASRMQENLLAAGTLPKTPLEELTVLPQIQ